jgi:hypothetical protein
MTYYLRRTIGARHHPLDVDGIRRIIADSKGQLSIFLAISH